MPSAVRQSSSLSTLVPESQTVFCQERYIAYSIPSISKTQKKNKVTVSLYPYNRDNEKVAT